MRCLSLIAVRVALTRWVLGCFVVLPWTTFGAAGRLDFQRDVRPVLAEHCFACHGQDEGKRKGKLRLDLREGAVADLGGHAAVVPGKPEASTLVQRIFSADSEERMPPTDVHRPLTEPQKNVLRQWVVEGAGYQGHWAFQKVVRPPLPEPRRRGWARHPVDRFILARLETEGLAPSAEAEPETWLRRVSLDLVGLAPTPREIDRFVADVGARGEIAYEAAVDGLLGSPRFGERQAQEWLDLARYADTHGFNNDTTRTMWRWRDWVIEAFNGGLPYDRFLTEQLAGDLLPDAGLDQRIATGFGRNHVVNSEGGIIDEEYRVEYVADRVRTLGMAWMGLTLECSRCHDHKYDPISQRDYYRLFAFFNNVAEVGEDGRIGNAAPILLAPTRPQQERLGSLEIAIARETGWLENAVDVSGTGAERTLGRGSLRGGVPVSTDRGLSDAWDRLAQPPTVPPPSDPVFALSTESRPFGHADARFDAVLSLTGQTNVVLPVKPAIFSSAQPWTLTTWLWWDGGEAPILSTMDMLTDPSAGSSGRGAEVRIREGGRVEVRLAEFWPAYSIQLETEETLEPRQWRHVTVSYDGSGKGVGVRVLLEGWPVDVVLRRDGLPGKNASGHAPRLGATIAKHPEVFRGRLAGFRLYSRVVEPGLIAPWVEQQAARCLTSDIEPEGVSPVLARSLAYRTFSRDYALHWAERERLREEKLAVLREAPQTMVMAELPKPRQAHVLKRGQYAALGDAVDPGVPDAMGVDWPSGAPRNRLGLARWLTLPEHPLTSRVVVNRVWAQLFGTGLVKTVEDFGVQGEFPSHPELLDWMAREFVDSGWDLKRLFRGVVLSATYRQTSGMTPLLRERDPENRWLARGPRVRLPAEVIRDQALAAAGLLKEQLGGPSVFPVQPESLYQGVVVAADYPGTKWVTSEGGDRYRRSLYTFWKRTVPHPVMTTFDAPDREFCSARRLPTNTPLQALALMNEPTFVEAGARLGARARQEGGATESGRLAYLFRLATGRQPEAREVESLGRTLASLTTQLGHRTDGGTRTPAEATEAAWAALGSLVLNLDETITKN